MTAAAAPLGHKTTCVAASLPASPYTFEPRSKLLNTLRDLHDTYRDHAQTRTARCGMAAFGEFVDFKRATDRRSAFLAGIARCGSVWECPTCSAVIKARRAQEVQSVVAWHRARHGDRSASMLTLTARHYARHDLKELREGVAQAWRKVIQHRDWRKLTAAAGIVGTIRATEVTHGRNGWHPHIHAVLLHRAELTPAFTAAVLAIWKHAVRRVLGPEHEPNEHGAHVSQCDRDGRYLAKLGLEISAPGTKTAKDGHRNPLDILLAFQESGDTAELALYQAHAAGMRGARQLTWSRGLKAAAKLAEKSDEKIANEETGEGVTVCRMERRRFYQLALVPGLITSLLERLEFDGPAGFFDLLDRSERELREAGSETAAEFNAEWQAIA